MIWKPFRLPMEIDFLQKSSSHVRKHNAEELSFDSGLYGKATTTSGRGSVSNLPGMWSPRATRHHSTAN